MVHKKIEFTCISQFCHNGQNLNKVDLEVQYMDIQKPWKSKHYMYDNTMQRK